MSATEGRCATCRHWRLITRTGKRIARDKPIAWDESGGAYIYPYESYEYTERPEIEGCRPCVLLNDDRKRANLIVYHDDDARIETAPDFGCVQWQAEEAP